MDSNINTDYLNERCKAPVICLYIEETRVLVFIIHLAIPVDNCL